jgi:hypothetical protein
MYLTREYAYINGFTCKVYLPERDSSVELYVSKHTGFQSFDINGNKVLLAYFQMCGPALCNMQENLKKFRRAFFIHLTKVERHCIKDLFSYKT